MPAALLARFSRATAEQVVTTIEGRMAAPRQRGFRARLAGRELRSGSERDFAAGFLVAGTRLPVAVRAADGCGGCGTRWAVLRWVAWPRWGWVYTGPAPGMGHARHGRLGGHGRLDEHGRRGHAQLGRRGGLDDGHDGPARAEGRRGGDGRLRAGGRRVRRRFPRLDGHGRRPHVELRVRAEPREPRRHAVAVEPQLAVALHRHGGRAVARRRRAHDDVRVRLLARGADPRPGGGPHSAGRLQRPERRADDDVDDRLLPVGGLPGQ